MFEIFYAALYHMVTTERKLEWQIAEDIVTNWNYI